MATRLFEDVCTKIRRDISNGTLRPGDKLPSERELAEELKVGRPVVREALRSLEEAGILEFRRGVSGGAFIRSGDAGTLTRSITDMVFLNTISVENLTEARTCLMSFAARLACERGNEQDFAALDANIDEMMQRSAEGLIEHTVESIGIFYILLGRAAHNEVLTLLIRSLTGVVMQILLKTQAGAIHNLAPSRRRLVAHLRNRDADAAEREIADHLAELHETVVARSRQLHDLGLDPFQPERVVAGV